VYKFLKYWLIVTILVFISACSTKRNTAITRSYHNVTSLYNILFNGEESFKEGIQKLVETYDDDFTVLLPVFFYTDKNALSAIGPEMDRSIKKATKLISMHSLTVKPEMKPDKELSQKQKEFFNKKEYNRFVDEAYLLMGKAHFYKMEYARAKETFNYITSNFPDNITVYETHLWLARLANEEKRFRESEDILSSLEKNIEFPKHLNGELFATWADYYLKQELYSKAVDPLKKAIEYSNKKYLKIRYTYILAQVYALIHDYTKASESYNRVIRMNPPYKMAFNAKINRALTYQSGTGSRKDIEKQLQKMLKDDKNIEFKDQIYYAMGNLYFKDKMLDETIKYYKLSIESSTENIRQKAKTSLTLADIYYEKPDYISAQAFYDTAISVIDPNYPDYQTIYAKSVSLTNLVQNIRTVEFEDSVLKLADLPETDLLALIDHLIEEETRAEEEKRLLQQQMAEDRLNTQLQSDLLTMNNNGGNWYFYNPAAKSAGNKEFLRVWGNRKLEDNWRRKNKSTVSFEELASQEDTISNAEKEKSSGNLVTNRKSREYYLQFIPFTDSAKQESLKKISTGLLNMGEIYADELKDYPKAIKTLEDLLKRFPQYENKLQIYYKLFSISKLTKDIERYGLYQQKIINEYPTSNFAKLMTNPNYIKEIQAQERSIQDEYEQIYHLFEAGNYSQVIFRSQKAMDNYPEHKLYPKLDYMHTISAGLQKDTLGFITDLQELIARYPSTDIAENAQIMIGYLQNTSPRIVVQQNQKIARELYSYNPDDVCYFAFIVPSRLNINQLIFNLVNFNLDNYDNLKLEVKRAIIEGKSSLCLVKEFENSTQAMEYSSKVQVDNNVFRDVDKTGFVPVVISKTNYSVLINTGKVDQYILFFNENYKQ
jgi:tetratricopeptide (TPR) repeat protein